MAIENCKELISRAQPHSDRHKNLVQKLVQLRLKLQELKVHVYTNPNKLQHAIGQMTLFLNALKCLIIFKVYMYAC